MYGFMLSALKNWIRALSDDIKIKTRVSPFSLNSSTRLWRAFSIFCPFTNPDIYGTKDDVTTLFRNFSNPGFITMPLPGFHHVYIWVTNLLNREVSARHKRNQAIRVRREKIFDLSVLCGRATFLTRGERHSSCTILERTDYLWIELVPNLCWPEKQYLLH